MSIPTLDIVAAPVPTQTMMSAGMLKNAIGCVPSIMEANSSAKMPAPIPMAVAAFISPCDRRAAANLQSRAARSAGWC